MRKSAALWPCVCKHNCPHAGDRHYALLLTCRQTTDGETALWVPQRSPDWVPPQNADTDAVATPLSLDRLKPRLVTGVTHCEDECVKPGITR